MCISVSTCTYLMSLFTHILTLTLYTHVLDGAVDHQAGQHHRRGFTVLHVVDDVPLYVVPCSPDSDLRTYGYKCVCSYVVNDGGRSFLLLSCWRRLNGCEGERATLLRIWLMFSAVECGSSGACRRGGFRRWDFERSWWLGPERWLVLQGHRPVGRLLAG